MKRGAVQNFTVSLPRDLVRRTKVLAARRDTSVSALVREALEAAVASGQESPDSAWAEALRLMNRGFDLGTGGRTGWTRDELHER